MGDQFSSLEFQEKRAAEETSEVGGEKGKNQKVYCGVSSENSEPSQLEIERPRKEESVGTRTSSETTGLKMPNEGWKLPGQSRDRPQGRNRSKKKS